MKRLAYFLGMFGMGVCIVTLSSQNRRIQLPSPRTAGTVSVEEALTKRRSIRSYNNDPLTLEEVSQLIWAAQGITEKGWGGRTAPSAGATYPLEVYIVVNRVRGLDPGIYHYVPGEHVLELLKTGNLGREISAASLGQEMVEKAAINIVIAAVFERTTARYGDRGRRYVYMEVGHVGQNLYLQAEALGLGTVAVGAFYDNRVKTLLGLDEDVLYIMPVGRKSSF